MNEGDRTGIRKGSTRPTVLNGTQPHRSETAAADSDLVRRLLLREECAWREFIARFRNLILERIHSTAREFRRPEPAPDLVDEICADVFNSLLSRDMDSLRRFEHRCRLSTWLAVLVRRITIRSLSRLSRQPRQPESGELNQIPHRPVETTETDVSAGRQLSAAMHELSPDDQQLLKLYYEDQQSYARIGELLGISENSVGPKLHRVRERLRSLVRRHQDAAPIPDD